MARSIDSSALRIGLLVIILALVTAVPPAIANGGPACVGDCDNSGAVSIDEVLKGIQIVSGDLPPGQCLSFECNATEAVTIDCMIRAVAAALGGCPTPDGTARLFTMSNTTSGNSVVAYEQRPDGMLMPAGTYATGGLGVGHGLENQGALVLSEDRAYVLVVNPGSDDLSAFRITRDGLQLTDRAPSGGRLPVSVAERGGLVYVLNRGSEAGDPAGDTISALHLEADGELIAIPDSTLPLSARSTGAVQVAFSPDGAFIVVTERDTGLIDTFSVDADGLVGNHHTQPSAGRGPFGFAFRNPSQVYVSEAGSASASAYELDSQGFLHTISAAVQTGQSATCWLAITPDQRRAFVANTSARSISAFDIALDGSLSLRAAVAATTNGGPLDLTISSNGQLLSVVTTSGNIQVFQIDSASAALTAVGLATGLPRGTNGLVGF